MSSIIGPNGIGPGGPGGGGGDYWVTPADLLSASTRTRTTAQTVQEQLLGIRNYVMRLEDAWSGPAHGQFLELMADWDIYSKMLNDALVDIAAGLEGNKVNYEQTERSNMNNLAGIDLPAARF
jgi:WXG100 family type VII secretion target